MIRFFRDLRLALNIIITGVTKLNTTVQDVKDALAAEVLSAKALLVKVQGLEALTNSIKAQLDTLIQAGSPSIADLTALRQGLLDAKQQTDDAAAQVDATVTADTPVPASTPPVVADPVPSADPSAPPATDPVPPGA